MKKCPSCGSTKFNESPSGKDKGDKKCRRCGYMNKKLAHISDDAENFKVYSK